MFHVFEFGLWVDCIIFNCSDASGIQESKVNKKVVNGMSCKLLHVQDDLLAITGDLIDAQRDA